MAFKRILITVDDDPVAAHAADVGIEMADALGGQIAFVHIVDPSLVFSPEGGMAADEMALRAQQDGARIIADFRTRLPAEMAAIQFVRQGVAGTEIANAARDWPADLIVIGSHGRRGLRRAVLGSVAEAVMRLAPCPVLVVRAKA